MLPVDAVVEIEDATVELFIEQKHKWGLTVAEIAKATLRSESWVRKYIDGCSDLKKDGCRYYPTYRRMCREITEARGDALHAEREHLE